MADDTPTPQAMQQALHQALGGASFFPEELRGDLQRAAGLADRLAAQATGPVAGDAWITRAVVALHAGDAGLAVRALDQALAQPDPAVALTATAWRHLAVLARFNTLPDGSAANSAEIRARWDGVAFAQDSAQRVQTLSAQVSDASLRQNAWLLATSPVAGLATLRYTVQESRWRPPPPDMAEAYAKLIVPQIELLQQIGEAIPGAAVAASDLAWRGGDPVGAETRLQRAEAAFMQRADAAGLAHCALVRGDRLAAPVSSPLAMNLMLAESGSESSDLAWTAEAIEGRRDGADAAAAAAHYAQAEALFARAGAPRGAAAVQLRRAWLAALAGDAAGARAQAEAAATAFARAGNAAGRHLAEVHAALYRIATPERIEDASSCIAAGRWGAGDGSFSQAIAFGLLCSRVGRDWLLRRGDAERALACYRLAEALFESLGAALNAAQSEVDQGRCAMLVGEARTAAAQFERAWERLERDARDRPLPGTDHALLRTMRRQGVLMLVYRLHLGRRDAEGMGAAVARLAPLAAEFEALLAAQASVDDVGALALRAYLTQTRETLLQAGVLLPLYRAVAARREGDDGAAADGFAMALAAARDAGRDGLQLEAMVLGQQRRHAEAVASYERYEAALAAQAGAFREFERRLVEQGGEQGAAEAAAQRRRPLEQRFAFMAICKDWSRARSALDALVAEAGADWWRGGEKPWQNLLDRAELEEGEGRLEAASATLADAIADFESRRAPLRRDDLKLAIAGDRNAQWLYFTAARVALVAGQPALAFARQEAGRGRALLDLMAGMAAPNAEAGNADTDLPGRWRQAQAELALQRSLLAQARALQPPPLPRIAAIEAGIDTREAALVGIEAELARSHPALAQALGGDGRPLALDEVCALLPPGAALISVSFLNEHLLGWGLDAQGLAHAQVMPLDAESFARQLRAFHAACASRRELPALAAEIARVMLEPFADLLRAHRRVVFVPYGDAHLLPWAALPFDGVPLGATHAISVLPSASVLRHLGARDRPLPAGAATPMIVVGNPEGNLPGAELEASAVGALYGEPPLLRDAATLQAVLARLPGRHVLHFAAHGQLVENAPLASALRLAGGDALSVQRLAGMQLQADLVVLSACETGRGENSGGDDIVGLARGLLAAGARAVVVSLWPVDDVSAALLMQRFHRALVAGRVPAEALHEAIVALQGMDPAARDAALAELRLGAALAPALPGSSGERRLGTAPARPRDDLRQPFHWAPFVLVG